jgi:transposase
MDSKTSAPRRRHSRQLKTEVLAACAQPGASVAAVALAHGLNANLVHKWRRQQTPATAVAAHAVAGEFIALPAPPPTSPGSALDIRIELRRGATAIAVHWPVAAAADCGAWLGQWLK